MFRIVLALTLAVAACDDSGMRNCAFACGTAGMDSVSAANGCKCNPPTPYRSSQQLFCDTCKQNCPGGVKDCTAGGDGMWGPGSDHCECFPPPQPATTTGAQR